MNDEMKDMEPQEDIELTGEDNNVEPELEEIEDATNQKVKKLQVKLKKCEEEKSAHLDNLQRAKAEFLNTRKRLEEEKQRDKERVTTNHVSKLLPLCDSFQMAMSNEVAWNNIDENWRKGVESIFNQLQKILEGYGVTSTTPLNEEFDPSVHEAMSEVEVSDKNLDNVIIQVIQPGYVRTVAGKTETIRPARVSVGIYKE